MKKSRLEWKVGLFVIIGLLMIAGLIVKFSKSTPFFVKTYDLFLTTSNVGGVIPGAMVYMSGVPIGHVEKLTLDRSGRFVVVHVKILKRFRIFTDAHFTIQQAGFLGDQYIAVIPGENKGRELQGGETLPCEEPFNIQEMARSASGLLKRVDETAARLNDAAARLDRTLLAESNLTNLTAAIVNFRHASDKALRTLDGVDRLLKTNTHPLSVTVSNLALFSEDLNGLAYELRLTIATNRTELSTSIKNIESATKEMDKLATELQKGKGLAGSLLKNEDMERDFREIIGNVSMLTSNLNKYGLLYKPRVKRTNTLSRTRYTGKDPTR